MRNFIGTHNSATGERPLELVSLIGQPVAKCQDKTIKEQLEAGVRLFDLRVKPYCNKGSYNLGYPLAKIQECHLGHGMCDYMMTLGEAFVTIEDFQKTMNARVYVLVTLEGKAYGMESRFLHDVQVFASQFSGITLLEVNVKKPEWTQLWRHPKSKVTYTKDYPLIKGWKVLLPFPRLWHWLKNYRSQIKQGVYSLRDFV